MFARANTKTSAQTVSLLSMMSGDLTAEEGVLIQKGLAELPEHSRLEADKLRETLVSAGIPKASIDNELYFIFCIIPNTPFFQPDGHTKEEWEKVYEDVWGIAVGKAGSIARRTEQNKRKRGTYLDAVLDTTIDNNGLQKAMATAVGVAHVSVLHSPNVLQNGAKGGKWELAEDIALVVKYLGVAGLVKDNDELREHVLGRWEVWQKGYRLLHESNGVLYVQISMSENLRDEEHDNAST